MAVRTETMAFRVSPEEKQKFEAIAKEKDIPVSQLIREAVRQYIQQESN